MNRRQTAVTILDIILKAVRREFPAWGMTEATIESTNHIAIKMHDGKTVDLRLTIRRD